MEDSQLVLAFETRRLRVYKVSFSPIKGFMSRLLFLAFRTDVEWFPVAVNAMVNPNYDVDGDWYVDWIETGSHCRRKGFARELQLGIEEHLGRKLFLEGVTPEGEAFCEAMEERPEG